MRVIVVGLGVQGKKRLKVAKEDVVCTVDPFVGSSDYKNLYDVPLSSYDSAMLCIQDDLKIEFITYLLKNKKNILVEKPIFSESEEEIAKIIDLANKSNVSCYTAYNHRFEPHFINMKNLIQSGEFGKVYSVRMFYGNGTAKLVNDSKWRDSGKGVLPDLGSHLLDTLNFWFDEKFENFRIIQANTFENKAYDNVIIDSIGNISILMEMSLTSWRNHFFCDVVFEKGSAHISSLCKWGPSSFITRKRELPSGKPDEKILTLSEPDPTWISEYEYFKSICKKHQSNTENDLWINNVLRNL
jgi:scyllo-inositol 2-dehydrogenase (NADP+)